MRICPCQILQTLCNQSDVSLLLAAKHHLPARDMANLMLPSGAKCSSFRPRLNVHATIGQARCVCLVTFSLPLQASPSLALFIRAGIVFAPKSLIMPSKMSKSSNSQMPSLNLPAVASALALPCFTESTTLTNLKLRCNSESHCFMTRRADQLRCLLSFLANHLTVCIACF